MKELYLIEKIKGFLVEKLLLSKLFLNKKDKIITNFNQQMKNVKKILVIFSIKNEEHDSSLTFTKKLSKIFPDAEISTFELKMLRKSDMNWLGVPNKQFLDQIRIEKYDLLVDINTVQDRLCCYLDALSNATLRIHLAEGKFDYIYNIQIRSDENIPMTSRYDTLLNYLEILHKN